MGFPDKADREYHVPKENPLKATPPAKEPEREKPAPKEPVKEPEKVPA